MGQLKNFASKELVICNFCGGVTPEFMKEYHDCPTRRAACDAMAEIQKSEEVASTPEFPTMEDMAIDVWITQRILQRIEYWILGGLVLNALSLAWAIYKH
jgi:hypothetical protein